MSVVGIVGFGVVGKSVLSFLSKYRFDNRLQDVGIPANFTCYVWDSRLLDDTEREAIQAQGAIFINSSNTTLEDFFHACDIIIPSPGVNMNAFMHFRDKMLCELDIFSKFYQRALVAVTGTLGKTTTTKLIGELLPFACQQGIAPLLKPQNSSQCTVAVGGNIGTAMLDIIFNGSEHACVVLELSSWQLELSERCAPDIAIFTNFYANHLDRHQTKQNYFEAKFKLFAHQKEGDTAIIAGDILQGDVKDLFYEKLPSLKSRCIFTSLNDQDLTKVLAYKQDTKIIFIKNEWVILRDYETNKLLSILPIKDLSPITFVQNWLQVIAALYAAGMTLESIGQFLKQHQNVIESLSNHHHRVQHFATLSGIDFYDDSKSTVVQATQAAVQKLAALQRPLIVILGGLGKGVDRSELATFLKQQSVIKKIYCFGKDCGDFSSFNYFETLEEIILNLKMTVSKGDVVLFSPSGASFDLFKDYKHRGKVFQELVLRFMPGVQ